VILEEPVHERETRVTARKTLRHELFRKKGWAGPPSVEEVWTIWKPVHPYGQFLYIGKKDNLVYETRVHTTKEDKRFYRAKL